MNLAGSLTLHNEKLRRLLFEPERSDQQPAWRLSLLLLYRSHMDRVRAVLQLSPGGQHSHLFHQPLPETLLQDSMNQDK